MLGDPKKERQFSNIITAILHPDIDLDYPDLESAFDDEMPLRKTAELELLKAFFTELRSPEIPHGRRLRLWERLGGHWYVDDAAAFLHMLQLFQTLVEDELAKR